MIGAALAAVEDAMVQAKQAGGAVTVEREVTTRYPARTLIELSQDAEMLVVGWRGDSPLAGLLTGSV